MKQGTLNKSLLIGLVASSSIFWASLGYSAYEDYTHIKTEIALQETIDKQSEMLYNKDIQLNDYKHQNEIMQSKVDEDENALKNKSAWVPVTMTITFYTVSADECGNANGITTSGRPAIVGRTIASNSLPMGTKVMIDGNVYTVEDTGGMDANTLDVLVSSKAEAFKRGIYTDTVYILK